MTLLCNRVRRVTVKCFGTFHQRLGQRRMRMHGERNVFGGEHHLDSERGFRD